MKILNSIKPIFQDKLAQALIAIFSIVFGLVKSLSEFVYNQNELNIDIMQSGIYAVICYLVLNFAHWVITRDYKVKPIEIKSPAKLWWIFFALFLVIYTICWLTYWPGTVSIDNWYIAKEGLIRASQHPMLYCLYIISLTKLGIWLGSLNYSIIIYTILQIVVVSIYMAYMFLFIFQRKIPHILKTLLLVSCLFIPIYAMYAISNVKDVYWSLCMADFIILLYFLLQSPQQSQNKRFWIVFNLCLLGIVLFRNNGLYIVLITMGILLYILPQQRKKLIKSIGIMLLAILLCSMCLKALNIQSLFQEKVGVPIQQIAAIIKKDGNITSEQVEFFSKFTPINEIQDKYNPYNVDTIKWRVPGADRKFLNEHATEFLKIWVNVIIKNYKISTLAYLQAIYWYWAPNEQGNVYPIKTTFPNQEHALRPWVDENGCKTQEIIPTNIKKYLIKYYNLSHKFYHEGSLFWILAGFALLYFLKRHSFKDVVIYLPIFLLWLTLMAAAPVHDFRYVLSYIYALPFFIALLFTTKDDNINTELHLISYKNWSKKTKQYVRYCIYIFIAMMIGLHIHIPLEARIDLFTHTKEPVFNVYLKQYGNPVPEASWMPKFGNRGFVVYKHGNSATILISVLQNSDITIDLRGPYVHDESGKHLEKWVKYTDFRIDNKKILSEPVAVWHDKPFKYILHAQKDHLYKVDLKWRKK